MRRVAQPRIEPVLLDRPLPAAGMPLQRRSEVEPRRASTRSAERARRSGLPYLLLVLLAVLAAGWAARSRQLINPEHGIGYGLGIAAGVMLLTVLLYPFRKRSGRLLRFGTVGGWFRLHMSLGLTTPALVLLHSNFEGGALNSNVALGALLIVAVSGLVGRYLYSRIHRGLYGAKANAAEYLAEASRMRQALSIDTGGAVGSWDALRNLEQRAFAVPRSTVARMWHAHRTRRSCQRVERKLIRECSEAITRLARAQGWPRSSERHHRQLMAGHIRSYFASINRVAALALFERLFGLWHVLHVPLFIVLIGAVIMHVIAVHLY